MKRLASVAARIAAACVGVVIAVLLAAGAAGAEDGLPATGQTAVVDTVVTRVAPVVTPTVTTKTRPSRPAPERRARRPAVVLPRLLTAGVSVGGTLVGGLTRTEARTIVEQRFARPLTLVLSATKRIRVAPSDLGARADIGKALRTAANVHAQGFLVPLDVSVSPTRVRHLLEGVARDVRREPRDARLVLRNLAPELVDARPGIRLNEDAAARAIVRALRTHDRDEIVMPLIEKPAKVGAERFRTAIVIRRGSNRLSFYVDAKLKRTFVVATGRAEYPTPLGRFEVVDKQRNPWWYPPQSDWARKLAPVPPGPGNPLGTRWMGISSPNVGIHGTPDAASIGYSASHGCIRMLIPQVEWLFDRVEMGTPVFVVAA